MEKLALVQEFLGGEKMASCVSLLREYKWYLAGTAAAGYVLLKVVTRPRNLPPGPRGWPLVGAVTEMSAKVHEDAMRFGKQYNSDIVSVYFFGTLMVYLNTRELVHEVLVKRGEEFAHRPPATDKWFQDEIFAAPYNEQWKANKKFALSTLRNHGYGTKAGEGVMLAAFNHLASEITTNGSGKVLPEFTLKCKNMAACLIFNILIGNEFNMADEDFLHFYDAYQSFAEVMFDETGMMAFMLPEKVAWVLFHSYIKKSEIALSRYSGKIQAVVREHVRTYDPENPRNVIDDYIKARGGENVDPMVMASNILVFSADAIETFSTCFSSFFFYMAKHAHVQARVQQQLDSVVGSGRLVTLGDKKSLPLVDAVIYETLRLVSPFAMSAPREIKEKTTLAGYTLPAGAQVIPNIWAVHYDERVYPQPTKFNIDNFLDADGQVKVGDFWMPFSAGRRMCMGESLVKMEFFLLLANLLLKFKVTFPEEYKVPEDDDFGFSGIARESPKYQPIFTER